MAKVTLTEAAAPSVVDKKPRFESITDSLGRTIQLRKLDPIQESRIVRAVGGDVAGNHTFMAGYAMPAAMVAHIDDDFFGLPDNIKQIETMLALLGPEGMEAITKYFVAKHEAAEAAKKAADNAEQAAAKN